MHALLVLKLLTLHGFELSLLVVFSGRYQVWILEKYALSALTSSPAHVCDVARAAVEYDCNAKICKSLEMLLADDSVQATRVKQRLKKTDVWRGACSWVERPLSQPTLRDGLGIRLYPKAPM